MNDENELPTRDVPQLPVELSKPSFIEWAEGYLPFKLPRLAFPQTAKNLDKAAARILEAGGDNAVARIGASTAKQTALGAGTVAFIEKGFDQAIDAANSTSDQRAANYFLREARIHQSNREKILELTAEDLESKPILTDASSEISDDWLNTFSRIASEKSDADIQQLWARLLAGEIRGPGSVKLRTLSHLATFDKDDANFAYDFLRNSISSKWVFGKHYDQPAFYGQALRAAELGLIAQKSRMNFKASPGAVMSFVMGKRVMQITAKTDQIYNIDSLPLTSFGESLCVFLRDTKPHDEYFRVLFDDVKRDGVSIVDMSVGSEVGPGMYQVIKSTDIWPVVDDASSVSKTDNLSG